MAVTQSNSPRHQEQPGEVSVEASLNVTSSELGETTLADTSNVSKKKGKKGKKKKKAKKTTSTIPEPLPQPEEN